MANHQAATPSSGLDFETLLHRCADKAYNVAYRLSGNDADAQDLVQEAFSRAFEHRDRYDPDRPFEAWLYRILHNVFLDAVRRYEHRHKVSLDAPPPANEEGSWESLIKGKDKNPLEVLAQADEERQLQIALRRLPPHYRAAVVLYDIEGLSYDAIAKILDCPMGTVCSRIHQGRVLLRRELEENERSGKVRIHDQPH
jgi:RNA polymerase sigma-70 factor (ECF subfamily)